MFNNTLNSKFIIPNGYLHHTCTCLRGDHIELYRICKLAIKNKAT